MTNKKSIRIPSILELAKALGGKELEESRKELEDSEDAGIVSRKATKGGAISGSDTNEKSKQSKNAKNFVSQWKGLPEVLLKTITPELLAKYNEVAEDSDLEEKLQAFRDMFEGYDEEGRQSFLEDLANEEITPMTKLRRLLGETNNYMNNSVYGRIRQAGGAKNYIEQLEDMVAFSLKRDPELVKAFDAHYNAANPEDLAEEQETAGENYTNREPEGSGIAEPDPEDSEDADDIY